MRVLLAGPGTGKTTKIRTLLSEMSGPTNRRDRMYDGQASRFVAELKL